MAEIIYVTGEGDEYTESQLIELAEKNGKSVEEFKSLIGAVLKQSQEIKKEPISKATQGAAAGSKENNVPDVMEPFSVNTSTVSLDKYLVSASDLAGDETDVVKNINRKLSQVGLNSTEGTAWGSLDAINLSKFNAKGIEDTERLIPLLGIEALMQGISVSDDDDLAASAEKINEYIKNNGNPNYLNEANARSAGVFEEYNKYIKAPEIENIEQEYWSSLRNKFAKIKKTLTTGSFSDIFDTSPKRTKDGTVIYREELTEKDFDSQREFELYQIYEKGGDFGKASEEELLKFDAQRKADYKARRSSEFANDLDQKTRDDILALTFNLQNQAIETVKNLPEEAKKFESELNTYRANEEAYAKAPSFEGWTNLTTDFENLIESQANLQESEKLVNQYIDVAPLAIKNFGADYNRLRQLRTGFKNIGVDMMYIVNQMDQLSGEISYRATGNPMMKIQAQLGEDQIVDLSKSIDKETATYQESLKIDEIKSASDAGRWVAASTTELIPSFSMALTGSAALPLFFLSGAGSAGLEVAKDQKDAAIRLKQNLEKLETAEDPFSIMALESEIEKDKKTLKITPGQKLTKQFIDGIAEVMFEKYGTMLLLKQAKKGLKMIPKQTITESIVFAGKEMATGLNREGLSEWGTNAIQNWSSIYVLDQNKNLFPEGAVGVEKFKGVFTGGLEVYAKGALMGGAISGTNGIAAIKQAIASELYTKADLAKLKNNLKAFKELTGINLAQNSSLDITNIPLPMRTPEVNALIEELQSEKFKLDSDVLNRLGTDLTLEQAYEIGEVNYKIRENSRAFQEASMNPNITPVQLRQLETKYRNNFNELMGERESLLTNKDASLDNLKNKTLNQLKQEFNLGYQMYSTRMQAASFFNLNKQWDKLSQEEKQSYYDKVREVNTEGIEGKGKELYFKEQYTKGFDSGLENAKAFADQFITKDINFVIAEGKDKNKQILIAYARALEDSGLKEKDKKERLARVTEALNDGSFDGVSEGNFIIIDKDASIEKMRTGIAAHEVLHPYVKQQFKNQKNIDEKGQELLDYMEKSQPDLHAQVIFRLESSYTKKDADGKFVKDAAYYEEALNALSDVLADNSGEFGSEINADTINVIRNFINLMLPSALQFKENEGFNVFQFVKNFNGSAHFGGKFKDKGKVPAATMPEDEKQDRAQTLSLSKSAQAAKKIVDDIGLANNYDPNSEALAKQLPGMIDAVISKTFKGLRNEVQKELNQGVQFALINPSRTGKSDLNSFIPAEYDNDGKKIKGNTSLYGYLNFRINKRILDVLRLNPTLINNYQQQIDDSTLQISGDANVKTNAAVTEKQKYKSLLASKVFDTDALKNVNQKIIKTVRVLKNRIDKAVSKNVTQTPIVREIKQSIANDVDIDIKKEMGGKANDKFKNFLIKNKKAILENATTSWLSVAFPAAIQKKVNGVFTSDWKGKVIDISDTSTNQAGMTSGFQLIRRLPNANNQISDEQFLDNYFKNGNVIASKKESLAKELGAEVSFEIMSRDLATQGPIYQALVKNQQALGYVFADNTIENLSNQMERGQIKFSVTSQEMTQGLYDLLDVAVNYDTNNSNFIEAKELQPKEIQDEWDNLGLNELFGDGVSGFKSPLIQLFEQDKMPAIFKPYMYVYRQTITARAQEVSMDQLRDFSEALMKEMPSDLVKFLGPDVFAITNRYLDGAITKRDKKGNIIPDAQGKYVALANLRKEIIENVDNLDLPFNPADIEIFNSSSGLMQQIGNVLSKKISKADKIKEIERRFGDRIRAANAANHAALGYLMDKATELLASKPELAPGFMRWQESNTSNARGMRGLTTLNLLDIREGSQAANEFHPDYLQAVEYATEAAEKAYNKLSNKRKSLVSLESYTQNRLNSPTTSPMSYLRFKGEHVDPAANVSLSLAEIVLNNAAKVIKTPVELETILTYQAIEVGEAIANYTQTLGVKLYSDIQDDAPGGTTSRARDFRMLALNKGQRNNFTTLDGISGDNYIKNEIIKLSDKINIDELTSINSKQKAIQNAESYKLSLTPKGITVLDFDDTLAITKSNVLYTMPDGVKGKIDATEFAARSAELESKGAKFDFSEFDKVIDGKTAPLFKKALKLQEKFGPTNMFVLTARPMTAAPAIEAFLKTNGLNIPIKNITGLEDGKASAKADWVLNKAAEGYNDFYFADDAIKNVKAVRDALETVDVKSKVQQARINFSKTFSTRFNDMIERNKGVASEARYSEIVARRMGAGIGKYKVFLPPSAEDFEGMTSYVFAGKGKQGNEDQKFFQDALIKPYMKGVSAIENSKQTLLKDYKNLQALSKENRLSKLIPSGDFTYDQAVRVFLWTKAGYEIPGISKRDAAKLNQLVAGDQKLSAFANSALLMSKENVWPEPSKYWDTQSLLSDLNSMNDGVKRKEYLAEFIENVDEIFSDQNLNKIQALYGTRQRDALEDIIYRMKTGTNRPSGSNKITNKWNNWVNNSIGAIMFFNRKSALLQTLSTVNFINWSDNNPVKAGISFANQPQFWKDFTYIFNSNKLKERRSGLKINVNESEIANAAKGAKNKANAVLAKILEKGFLPTQMVDSFAIAAGGASFYRNRVNTYIGQGLTKQEAEAKAWEDFSAIADSTQQSSDPLLISPQQASTIGRLVLNFQNVTMQYTRLMKKAGLDLIKRRISQGYETQLQSDLSNISKIIYYGAVQNAIFTALQNALFAFLPGFDEDEDEERKDANLDKKTSRMLNSMLDTLLKGSGLTGATISAIKNVVMKYNEQEKKGYMADHTYTILEAANISPPIGSKLRKIYSAIQTNKFEKAVIAERGFDITIDGKFNLSPKYQVLGSLVEGVTNFPADRIVSEINAIAESLDTRNTKYQRLALGLGWRAWDVNAKNEENDLIKQEAKEKKKIKSKEKSKIKAKSKRDKAKELKAEEAKRKADEFNALTKKQQDSILNAYYN